MFIWGLALALADLSASTVIPRVVDHRNAAAVSAINENLKLILEGVGAFGTPLLAQLLGPRLALVVGCEIVLVVMAIGWPLAHRAERDIAERMSTLALLQSVPLLRRLPLDAIETLAAGARSVSCAEGRQLIVAGDYGDTYWVLRSGSALVLAPGMEPKRLGPGSGFGEIGLLHAIPRTATVVAAEDAEALVIDRDSFLLAFTGLATVPEAMSEAMPEPMPGPDVPPGDADELIRAAPTVASLGERRAAEVARRAGRVWFAPGSVVFQAGDPADCCYVVLSGAVRVDAPGRMTTLGVGREFGSIGLRITGSRTATVTAVEATELAVLTAKELDPAGPETSAATAVPA
jgi:CRP-like cAMP-binding protein